MTTAVQRTPVDPAIGSAIEVYERLNVIRSVLAPDLTDQELQLFAIVAERSRLDPFAKQIYAIKRKGRVTFQTGIDGFRSSAEDTGEYRGSDEPEFGPTIADPFPHPEWARTVVHRQFANGEWLHQAATVYWDELYPGTPGRVPAYDDVGYRWFKMPRNQLAKCSEAAAFRKGFPKRFSDVYTPEEMDQADAVEAARPVGPTARERIAQRRAQLEQGAPDQVEPSSDDGEARERPPAGDGEAGKEAAAGPAVPVADLQSDVVEGEVVDEGVALGKDLIDRLREETEGSGTGLATEDQKARLRELLAPVNSDVLETVLERAFGQHPVAGKFRLTQGQAAALIAVAGADPERFVIEAAAMAAKEE